MTVNQAILERRLVVLPTETISRSFLTHFIKTNPSKAVFTDSVISWDTFKELCTERPDNLSEVTDAHRLLFSYSYLINLKGQSHFFNRDYPQTLSTSAAELSMNLPYLSKVENPQISQSMDKNLLSETEAILSSYRAYLKENSLYEKSFLSPDYTKDEIKQKRPIIVYPDNISDPDVEKAISDGIETLRPEEDEENTENEENKNNNKTFITRYPNTLFEIRATLEKIYGLLKDKTEPEEIAITSARLEEVEPYLRSESRHYKIKLNFVRSKKLTDWASGSFFKSISAIKSSDFDLQDVSAFLLNPAFPFKDRDLCSKAVSKGVECKIISGLKTWLYKTKDDKEISAFVLKFTDYVNGICQAKDAPTLRRALKGFQDDFFVENSWNSGSVTQSKVFMVCMDTLDELEKLSSLPQGVPFYDFYLNLLSGIYYAPGKGEEGIKVYSYPVSCPLAVKHHFVINLDDESSRQYRSILPFAEDMDEKSPLHKKNMAEDICASLSTQNISAQNINTQKTILSFSEQTYSSYCIAPSYFEQRSLVRDAELKTDRFAEEKQMWLDPLKKPSHPALSEQKEAFDRANQTVFPFTAARAKDTEEPKKTKIRISSTSLSLFESCPFAYKCRYIDGIKEEDFSVDEEDALNIGNLIHKTYETYFRQERNIRDLSKAENKELLKQIFLKNLENYSRSTEGPSELQIERIRRRYSDLLAKIGEVKDYEDFSESDMEYRFFFEEEGYYVDGYIDCIMRKPDGKYAVLDFKKREGDKSSPQLFMYAEGLKNDSSGKYSQYPSFAAFYGIEEKKNTVMWTSEEEMKESLEDFKTRLKTAVKAIENREFEPTPGNVNCTNCSYRRICRMRYVIK
ncbi:MAG: PD-(D/E)XK nuclease family protein [Sphaerochaetaceae bacterium]|nr:PD-(D/E)XK nuclease family protein [Sphaerochaetaceae bacterium]